VDVTRALDQIAEIHGQIAKGELYRGYRSLPIAASGVTFVITSRDYPLAQLGPLPSGIVSPASGCDSPAKP